MDRGESDFIKAVVAASLLALLIRYEGHVIEIPRIYVHKSLQYIPVIIIVTVVIFYGFRLYSSLWTFAGAPELINITFACALSSLAQMVVMVVDFCISQPIFLSGDKNFDKTECQWGNIV